MSLILLLACAKAPLDAADRVETLHQFKLESPFGTMAGLAAVVISDDEFVLQALTPAGVALFTVQGEAVSAPDEAWAAVLERIPFERDMRLVYGWPCSAQRCELPQGRLWQERTDEGLVRRYRGPGGPATVTLTQGKAVLVDPRRRTTLTMLGEAIHD